MADNKKFLDQGGVQYLWEKLSLEDYPNNETLIAVINAIDESKADKEDVLKLSNIIENYILNIDYENLLAFDTSEIVFGASNTTSVLGQAILGQMMLG